jgi:hypothetical protein
MRCNYVMLGLFMVPLLWLYTPDKKAEDRDCHTYREELDRIGQQTMGTPAQMLSVVEFHPLCVRT